MWKYLLLNNLWFLILMLVHFFGSKMDQKVILSAIGVLGLLLALKGPIDPIAWTYYMGFSILVFYGISSFRVWAFQRLDILRFELTHAEDWRDRSYKTLEEKKAQVKFLEKKGDEIVEFYDQIKEMSKSLNHIETFLIFSEALSEYFEFKTVKIAFFSDKHPDSSHPEEVYELRGESFKTVFDRSVYLKDTVRIQSEVFPADKKIYSTVFGENLSSAVVLARDFMVYPIRIQEKIVAILTVVGIDTARDPLFQVLIERFVAEIQRVRLYESVQKLAITDGLTGLFVRPYLMDRLMGETDRSKRFSLKLSFLMIDIDHFKRFNDEYGHLVGDVVLKQVAQVIKKSVREVDFVGRYGGEEFGVGLIETDEGTALIVAERIRKSIQDKVFKAYDEELRVQVSIGGATLSPQIYTVQSLVDLADDALYQAKRLGRNRVCMANPE